TGWSCFLLQSPKVELVFAAAIDIQGFVFRDVLMVVRIAFLPPPVSGPAGSVDERNFIFRTPLPKFLGVIGVHLPHISLIVVARVRASSQMDDSCNAFQLG